MNKEVNKKLKYKIIKLEMETHQLLQIHAIQNDLWLGKDIQDPIDKEFFKAKVFK